ncbi:MAG: hypothetical protein Q7R96_01480, partial [Nanoarchaeota archaeon]|nr:hypothetical protein [Nanoarchaeota archaeon]
MGLIKRIDTLGQRLEKKADELSPAEQYVRLAAELDFLDYKKKERADGYIEDAFLFDPNNTGACYLAAKSRMFDVIPLDIWARNFINMNKGDNRRPLERRGSEDSVI